MELKEKFISAVSKQFSQKSILVIGDLMVDEYILGNVSRVSPEAPVVVLQYKEKKVELGGAGNVAKNLKSLGCKTSFIGTVSDDASGMWLKKYLSENNIDIRGIVEEDGRPSTVKTRFATKCQQLLRLDNEDTHCIKPETQKRIIDFLKEHISEYNAVILSDYKKGVLNSPEFVQNIIKLCNQNNILVSIDSKSKNIEAFENADFVKPNNLELEEAVGIKIENDDIFTKAGNLYLEKSKAKFLIVTRGAKGISIFRKNSERRDYASKAIQVFDVTGAGDTVISTITLGLCSGLDIDHAVQLANLAASVVISKVGTATISKDELVKRINED